MIIAVDFDGTCTSHDSPSARKDEECSNSSPVSASIGNKKI